LRPTRPVEHSSHILGRREDLKGLLETTICPRSHFVWEVGSGHGHFLTAYAKAHPDKTCIGIDIMSDRVGRANRKRERARLARLHFIRADAEDFLAVMPEGARFDSIFVLFPDPWPKRRHHKNRVMKEEFLAAVAARCAKGTCLYFRTDYEPYFLDVAALLGTHKDWRRNEAETWPFEEETVFQKRAKGHFTLVARRR
jgi:tRNA (guanine-N7-)-methyltransferase